MRSAATALVLAAAVLLGAGCYHAQIETGKAPAYQTIEEPWAPSFLLGLVPPPVLDTASRCPNGVARVETRHSFLNQVAAAITFGIYTPMEIKAVCAQ